MVGHDIIVIGASAGGIDALIRLCRALPADLPAVICVVQHVSPDSPGLLGQILHRECGRPARNAEDGEAPELGTIYLAPPDRHLLLEVGRLRVVRGPRENLHRPSIDPLFRSAAAAFGARVMGVVLTGMLDDGTAGLAAIKRGGGVALVQDPAEAPYPSMPLSALQHVQVDHCLPLALLAVKLAELATEPAIEAGDPVVRPQVESRMALGQHNDMEVMNGLGKQSPYTCPDCHGALWELDDSDVLRFRCHIGHAYSAESLHAGQGEQQEHALSAALRALEEQASLLGRMALRARGLGNVIGAERFTRRAHTFRADAETIRGLLLREVPPGPGERDPDIIA